jgi:hypothetical protein
MNKGIFYAPDGAAGSGTGSGEGGQGGGAGAGAGGGQATDLAALNARLADLERQKSALEKDLHKEREGKKTKDAEAQAATEKAAATQKAVLETLKAAGFEIPGQDPTTEIAAKLKVIEDEKRKATDQERESKVARLTIEAALLKALAGKADDLDYALYRAARTAAFSDLKVEGDKVSGIEAVVRELTESGALKTGTNDDGKKKAPGTGGQPPLQGEKYPWREAKDWNAFLALPWETQLEAKKTDPDFVKNLEAAHFHK